MTEQPAEPITEQEWLQNGASALPEVPKQCYAPNAHRIPTVWRPAPVIALAYPFEVTEAVILLRKSVNASAKALQARKASEQAEDAFQAALAVENLADIDAVEAERVLLEFVREVAGQ